MSLCHCLALEWQEFALFLVVEILPGCPLQTNTTSCFWRSPARLCPWLQNGFGEIMELGLRGDGLKNQNSAPRTSGKERTGPSGLGIGCAEDLSVLWATPMIRSLGRGTRFSAYRIPWSPENLDYNLPSLCFPLGRNGKKCQETLTTSVGCYCPQSSKSLAHVVQPA